MTLPPFRLMDITLVREIPENKPGWLKRTCLRLRGKTIAPRYWYTIRVVITTTTPRLGLLKNDVLAGSCGRGWGVSSIFVSPYNWKRYHLTLISSRPFEDIESMSTVVTYRYNSATTKPTL